MPSIRRRNPDDSIDAHSDKGIRQIPAAAAKFVDAAGRKGGAAIIVPVAGHEVCVEDEEIRDSLLRWLQ